MTSKIFGVPLIIICLVLAILIPLGLGEMKLMKDVSVIKKMLTPALEVKPFIASPEVTPTGNIKQSKLLTPVVIASPTAFLEEIVK